MFHLDERTVWDNLKLTTTFGFLGGYTAVLSFLLLGIFVNCMSGNVTRTGIALGHFDFTGFFNIMMVFISFVFGAFLSTRVFDKFGHIPVLLIEAGLLLLIGINRVGLPYEAWLAATAMGLQNSLTTCVSWHAGKVRTTHVTGTSTDIGIAIADKKFSRALLLSYLLGCYLIGALAAFFISRKLGYYSFNFASYLILFALAMDLLRTFCLKGKNKSQMF